MNKNSRYEENSNKKQNEYFFILEFSKIILCAITALL